MPFPRANGRARSRFGLTLVLLSGLIVGCAPIGGGEGASKTSATADAFKSAREYSREVPSLQPGDRFSFDNPTVTWTVTAVEGERVSWISDTGDRQVTPSNPLLPALEWESVERGSGRRLISGQSEPMFPLFSGKTVDFRATVDTDRPPFAWEFDWSCQVGGIEMVDVPAGRFAAYRVACGRGDVEETVMYYAPEVGNHVRMLVALEGADGPVERRLTAFRRVGGMAGGMPDGTAPPAPGPVAMEDGSDSDLPLSIDQSTSTEGATTGPTALGMIAGTEGTGEGRVTLASPTTAPASGLETETMAAAQVGAADAAPAAGDIAVHLASYKDPANAEAGWKQLMSANRDVLDGMRPVVRKVDIPGKGTFYRLHAGPIAGMTTGESMCQTLSRRGVYCKVMTY